MARSAGTDIVALLMLGGAGAILAWPKLREVLPQTGLIPGVSLNSEGKPAAAKGGVALPTSGPLGIRNNNPGNIRPSVIPFVGTVGTNKGFAVFDSAENGVRALMKLLRNYQSLYGLNTIAKIARRYAPSNENNTAAWASNVALASGIGINAALNLRDPQTMFKLVRGIIAAENGRGYVSRFEDVLAKAWGRL